MGELCSLGQRQARIHRCCLEHKWHGFALVREPISVSILRWVVEREAVGAVRLPGLYKNVLNPMVGNPAILGPSGSGRTLRRGSEDSWLRISSFCWTCLYRSINCPTVAKVGNLGMCLLMLKWLRAVTRV